MGGSALIAGTVAMVITMTLHPSGHALLGAHGEGSVAFMVRFAHALAIAAMPILFLGALALSRRLEKGQLATAALVFYGFGVVAGMAAAALSGFVAPVLARRITNTVPPEQETWRVLFSFNGALNQAFAIILAIASSIAILLWSVAILRRTSWRALGIYGVVIGAAITILVGSGILPLNIHGFGLVVLLQGIWFVIVGIRMMQLPAANRPLPAS
jgi:hypothetical protein